MVHHWLWRGETLIRKKNEEAGMEDRVILLGKKKTLILISKPVTCMFNPAGMKGNVSPFGKPKRLVSQ